MALPLCKLSEVALIDEVALNIIGHDSYFVHFRFPTVFAVVVLVSHSMTQVRDTAQTGCVLLPTIDLAEESH